MHRRLFLLAACAVAGGTALRSRGAVAEDGALETLLKEFEANPAMVSDGWQFLEQDAERPRGAPYGRPSRRRLSQMALDTIITLEVSSRSAYEAQWRRPYWPGGHSGVTIGIGYDLRQSSKRAIDRDWRALSQSDRDVLATLIGLAGDAARQALPRVQHIDIPWDTAEAQFLQFIPYATHDTEQTFENCDDLSADSLGALVSLVYNRGRDTSESAARIEMYQIRQLMLAREFESIPGRLRAMKRLWEGEPGALGLVKRREAEALLFERGLRADGRAGPSAR